ncbi:MAG: hypothetical protein GX610_11415 [Rhodococcus sp.]|nr:hypothetical protein [Rhodococcus sp. (in: high G+C Gram-positive bacteria)]
MTTSDSHVGRSTRLPHVDVAGTRWPLYKLEALMVGVVTLLGAIAVLGSLEPAVLIASAVAVTVWWGRRIHLRRSV